MHYHKTPQAVVRLIRRHVPKTAVRVLEPAVGEGALLEALHPNQLNQDLTLVDIDSRRLEAIKAIYPFLSVIEADFLSCLLAEKEHFDLIITNPPFSGKVEKWIGYEGGRAPIEYLFLKKCINLLQPGGTLIAIVPDTVVNSSRLAVERSWMFSTGAVTYSYQLPERIFDNIEGSFYLLVFKKGGGQRNVKLRNFAGDNEIKLTPEDISLHEFRLDHSYYQSRDWLERLVPQGSTPLEEICSISRGPVRNNYKKVDFHHTNSFVDGIWKSFKESRSKELCVAVKRVSRDAHLSFGLFNVSDIEHSTDCLVFIRSNIVPALNLLFYLRVFFSNDEARGLLLKGVGAKFIKVGDLKMLPYVDLPSMFPVEYELYCKDYMAFNVLSCRQLEAAVNFKMSCGPNITLLRDCLPRIMGGSFEASLAS